MNLGKLKFSVLEQNQQTIPELILKQGKGVPFLCFELSRAAFTVLQVESKLQASFTMKEYCLLNTEKQSSPQMLSRSGNFDMAGLIGFS